MAHLSSEDVRKEGNVLYKASKFLEAAALYRGAAELAPTEAAPLSNLAAAHFESGSYVDCITTCDAALTLLTSDDSAASSKHKVLLRKAKAAVHSLRVDDAMSALSGLPNGTDKADIEQCVEQLQATRSHDQKILHTRLILELPRYKPMIRNVPEYFVVGHDMPEPLYDVSLLESSRPKISFLMGGIGDARHLHRSLIQIITADGDDDRQAGKCFHFTAIDHKPAVIARDLVAFLMLHDQSQQSDPDMPPSNYDPNVLSCLFYTYLAPIMPPLLYKMLQSYIRKTINCLEGSEDLPPFLDVAQMFRPAILKILVEWQSEAPEEYPTARMRKETVRTRDRDSRTPLWPTPETNDFAKQDAFYTKTGILMFEIGPVGLMDKDLIAAYHKFDKDKPKPVDARILDKVDSKWGSNVTFVDLAWERGRETWNGSPATQYSHADIDLAHDPFDFSDKLQLSEALGGKKWKDLGQLTISWFQMVASCLRELQGRLKIEACVGDVNCVLEQVRYGVVGHRPAQITSPETTAATPLDSSTTGNTSSADSLRDLLEWYPQVYDRIHLSNIPDYVGGSLTTFMYAPPVLYPGQAAYITSTCRRNPPRFKTPAFYHNEYIALSSPGDITSVFHVKMEPLERADEYPLMMTAYLEWHRQDPETTRRMPRHVLEQWLYRLFLKLNIPKERSPREYALLYSPLNITAFIRLCRHLVDVGYPAHWISGVLSNLLSGSITTQARPPRSEPLKISEVKEEAGRPATEQCTAPFVAELSTLLALWQCVLPFGILSPGLPDPSLVNVYNVDFESVDEFVAETPAFVLLLFDVSLLPPNIGSLRPYLLSDEGADRSPKALMTRLHGLHVLSSWDWDRSSKTATFWLRRDFFEALDTKKWCIMICRTDMWSLQAGPTAIEEVHDRGPWLNQKHSQ